MQRTVTRQSSLAFLIRPPTPADGSAIWDLARRNGLDENSPYAYLMWARSFAGTSLVAEHGQGLSGFVNAFRVPDEPDALFVWQIAVDRARRGEGVAASLLDELLARHADVRWLEATVTPSNSASAALFRGCASRWGAPVDEALVFATEHFPDSAHEPEIRFRIGPLPAR